MDIDLNMLIHLELFYAKGLGNHVHDTYLNFCAIA